MHYVLCIIFIIFAKNMAQQYFNQQDSFLASMIEAYHQGLFPGDEYKPYFDWKISKQLLSLVVIFASLGN